MKFWLSWLGAALVAAVAMGQGQTAAVQPDPQLQQLLQRYPDADANHDGVLTAEEARAYRAKMLANKGDTRTGRPAAAAPAIPPTLTDVKYGPRERNVLDFWEVKSSNAVPVLIYFHGGGFVGGNKSLTGLQIQGLKMGIAAVSANYPYAGQSGITIREIMLDGARVVQFVRSKAAEWHIDPARVALTGGSAGGDMSVWIALHDDLADPRSDDPVKRQSSRVSCVVGNGAQTSNDPTLLATTIGGRHEMYSSIPKMYNIVSSDELDRPDVKAMRLEYSAMNHASKDDPPLYLTYDKAPPEGLYPETVPVGEIIHTAKFGLILKGKLDPLGVTCIVTYPGRPAPQTPIEFLVENLRMPKRR